MKDERDNGSILLWGLGLLAVIWLAVLLAPCMGGGLPEMLPKLTEAMKHPFRISWCEATVPCVCMLSLTYGLVVITYHYSKPNYRRREEHGSARWGSAKSLHKKYHHTAFSFQVSYEL